MRWLATLAVGFCSVFSVVDATAATSDGRYYPCNDDFAKEVAIASGFAKEASRSNPNYAKPEYWLAMQTICADFDEDGSDEMVFSLGAMGGTDPWAFFNLPGGEAKGATYSFPTISTGSYPNHGLELVRVEGIPAIRDKRRLFRRGDAHCCPSGGVSIRVVGFRGGAYGVLKSSIDRAPPPPKRTRLTTRLAKDEAEEFLSRKYGDLWYGRYGERLNCNRKTGYSSRKCLISFGIGDAFWFGSVRVSVSGRAPLQRTHIRYRIKRFDEYCASVLHGSVSRCVKPEHGATHFSF